ncbi:MAG: hypothetical protein E6F99_30645 [Actinobacteria bacterium]|nr:MAG: hypothetical protein E6F99_30645 [Actinomycetota bacterium]
MDMRPRAELVRRRQGGQVRDVDDRQWAARRLALVGELAFGEHDQSQPGVQPAGGRVHHVRAVPPREVLVVELDERQEVRVEVGDPVARLGAHDGAPVHADDVARAVQRHVVLNGLAERATARGGGTVHP